MSERLVLSVVGFAVVVSAALAPPDASSQQRRNESAGSKTWTAPRTPWGDPDIQGLWPSGDWRRVPLQRPEQFGTRDELTPEEFAERERQAAADSEADSAEFSTGPLTELNNSPPSYWQDRGSAKLQASLIVDPPNGRLPPRTAGAEQRVAARAAARQGRGAADSWEDRSLYERCITRGVTSFLPTL